MGLDIQGVHSFKREEGTNRMVLVGSKPYSRFVSEGNTPIIVQSGKFWTDGGNSIAVDDVPDWVWKQLRMMNREGLVNIGLVDMLDRLAGKAPKGPQKLSSVQTDPVEEDKPAPTPAITLDDRILELIYDLDHTNADHWTKSGLPDLRHLKEFLGSYVSRATVEKLAPDIKRKE